MDGVIGVDAPLVHLAAALSKPVWVLLGPKSHWRWLRNKDDSPWYPTARLFRRSTGEDWKAVIRRIKAAIN
jgi:ADP-heptose:LPS heptosyltransferase